MRNSINVAGIGYLEYDQVLPSFNNYFGQRVMNFGVRNGRLRNGSDPGTCSSSWFWPMARCVTTYIKRKYPSYHFVDNCSNFPYIYVPYPWFKAFHGCQCKCVPEDEYPGHNCDPFCINDYD